jgi:poly-gamma-glutamate synthesis protein (capsule biosynthesis protein)
MRYKVIFIIFAISLLGFVFYFCLPNLNFIQKSDSNSNILKGETNQFVVQEEVKPEAEKVETTLLAVGDVMLSRHVGTKIRQANDPSLPFLKLKEQLSGADITFGNLESPFYDQGYPVTEGMTFKAEPGTIQGLIDSGFDILSLANNHFGDQGQAGMKYTFNWLDQHHLKYTGAGKDFSEAHQPTILEKNGIKFAFLGYGQLNCSAYGSTETKAGFACLDLEQMEKDVKEAKKQADLVVVSMHAGTEYTNQSTQKQKDFARAAIDSGAKLVLGHHPHVVQTTEKYKDGFIIYSLGNFVFDQMWSQETREGVMAQCQFEDKELKSVEFIPIIIENYSQPRLASSDESPKILKRMGLEDQTIEF